MSVLSVYRTGIEPDWIDYNGHLRDAYYGLIFSLAIDELMDRVGLHQEYRTKSRCTLYSLEMHTHFFREVKSTDTVDVSVRILGLDHKRIHAALDMRTNRFPEIAATTEVMLLHVYQGDEPKGHPFPPEISAALARIAQEGTDPSAPPVPGSRRMELRSRS